MYSHVAVILGLVCSSLAFPKTYQEQRQLVYSQAFPLDPYQLPQQQILQFQLPASTSFLPNNVPGVRYGEQQQVVYFIPGSGQVVYKEASTAPQGNQPYVDSLVNYLNGQLHTPVADNKPVVAQEPVLEKQADKPVEVPVEKAADPQAPTQDEQAAVVEEAHLDEPSKQEAMQYAAQPQLQALPAQAPPAAADAPAPVQTASAPAPFQFTSPQIPAQQYSVQQLPYQPLSPQEQNLLQQRLFFLSQPQQALYTRPELASPSANYFYNYRAYPLSDKKPGSSAIAFQKLLQKHAEATAASNSTEGGESTDSESPNSDEIGPSIAQAKPQAVSVAGPGGVAAAAPVGTAIVGAGGMALSAPTATAIAGTKTKPSDKTKSAYLSRTNLFPF